MKGNSFVFAIVALLYASASCAAFVAVGRDKVAALARQRRISEKNLHLLNLAGGWPGALLAQRMFRHKTRKPSFQFAFRVTIMINCAFLGWILFALT